MKRAVAVLAVSVGLAACNPGAREAQEFAGNWMSVTWGSYLSITGGTAQIYEFTDEHCFEVSEGGVRGVGDVLARDGDVLILSDSGRTVRFDMIDFLPTSCADEIDSSPSHVFDVLVATIEAHHAPGVDDGWADRVASLRPSDTATDDEVFAAVTALLDPLDDPDIRVATPDREIWRSLPPSGFSLPDGERSGNDGIVTALLSEDVAYIGLERMGGFGADENESRATVGGVVDEAAALDTIVLDLRATDGGSVGDAMAVARRFVPEDRLVARLRAVGPDGVQAAGETTVTPLQIGRFEGDLYVLIGPDTAGPSELLAQALADVEGVMLLGETTAGAPAPRMVRQLPNGWIFGLTNLIVTAADGTDLSGGVEPDVATNDALFLVAELAGFEL